jgi:membrane protein
MLTDLILISISFIIITLYLMAYILNVGLPSSISETYYKTQAKWLFPTCTATAGALAIIPMLNVTPDNYRFVAFFIVASILFVAAAPAFREELTDHVHTGAAITLGVSALAWLILTSGVPYIAITATLIGLTIDRRHFIFWLEAGLLYNIFVSLITVAVMN